MNTYNNLTKYEQIKLYQIWALFIFIGHILPNLYYLSNINLAKYEK